MERTQDHCGSGQMGKQLLRLFEPGMDAVMTRMGPLLTSREIIAIVKCHPELWRRRKTLLPVLLGHAVPQRWFETSAPPKYAAPLCKQLTAAQKKTAALTFLEMAAARGDLVGVKEIANAFNLSRTDVMRDQHNAFVMACFNGHLEVAKWLDDHFRLTKDHATAYNGTAFSSAAERGHLQLMKWMAERFRLTPADVRCDSNLSLRIALDYEHIDVADWLVEHFELSENDVRDDDNVAIREACERYRGATLDWMRERFGIDECDNY